VIAVGIVGVAAVLVLTDPLEGKLWAVAFVVGIVLAGAGMLLGAT
jgi:hypothetical protein